jgi:hypothetical protein
LKKTILLNLLSFAKFMKTFGKILTKNIEIAELCRGVFDYGFQKLCKGVLCVDLGESFQTHIYLQKLASIQPSPPKLAQSLREKSSAHRRR